LLKGKANMHFVPKENEEYNPHPASCKDLGQWSEWIMQAHSHNNSSAAEGPMSSPSPGARVANLQSQFYGRYTAAIRSGLGIEVDDCKYFNVHDEIYQNA
jgi:hypothetical protein